jgi:hypothetical protein
MVVHKRHHHLHEENVSPRSPQHRSVYVGTPTLKRHSSLGKGEHGFHRYGFKERILGAIYGSRKSILLLLITCVLALTLCITLRLRDSVSCMIKSRKKALADEEGFQTPYEAYVDTFTRIKSVQRPLNECARLLEFPQIGMLFLTHERIANEATWETWFSLAKEKIPIHPSKLSTCGRDGGLQMRLSREGDLVRACTADGASNSLDSQHLFDVWVHLSRGVGDDIYDGSIFQSKLIPAQYRVNATWGGHSLIDATRVLFAASLTNPLVTKLFLVSESDVPLYGPELLYIQLVSESKSRINGCNTTEGWDRNEYRLRQDFVEAGITYPIWRKSWQWIALVRDHADLVLKDTKVDKIFRSLCRPRWDHGWCDFRVCYSDEHYVPTLLAIHGLDNETDCHGELIDRDWSRVKPTDPHPYTYRSKDINKELFARLRHPEMPGCDRANLIQSTTKELFTTTQVVSKVWVKSKEHGLCSFMRKIRTPSFVPLASACPLLARKFSSDASSNVLKLSSYIFGY